VQTGQAAGQPSDSPPFYRGTDAAQAPKSPAPDAGDVTREVACDRVGLPRAAHLAIQVHGAYGNSAEYGIERYFRNARATIIYEGTTQVDKIMQAEHALGYRAQNGRDGDVSPITAWAPTVAARG
jgi:alkylation response protein AidB-like acyl-CoA dehydrogenase